MSIVKLPSGKTVSIPDGYTEEEALNFLFVNLPDTEEYKQDKKLLGDQLDTSGLGAAIGGTVGATVGSVAGLFLSPSIIANPLTLGVAGSAGGSAIGEGIEQWLTGKGDWGDLATTTVEGGAYGLAPGGAGLIAKGLKSKNLATRIAAQGVSGGGSAAAGTAVATGGDLEATRNAAIGGAIGGPIVKKILGGAMGKLLGAAGQRGLADQAKLSGNQYTSGVIATIRGKVTGRQTTDALLKNKAILDLQRAGMGAVIKALLPKATKIATAKAGRDLSPKELAVVKRAVNQMAKEQIKETTKSITALDLGGVGAAGAASGFLKSQTVKNESKGYAQGGEISRILGDSGNFNQGGEVEGNWWTNLVGTADDWKKKDEAATDKWAKDEALYKEYLKNPPQKQIGDMTIEDFIPIVGDYKAAAEVYQEVNKPNPNWKLVGILSAATAIGLIPGVGPLAAKAIKAGARQAAKAVPTDVIGAARAIKDGDIDFLKGWGNPADAKGVGAANPYSNKTFTDEFGDFLDSDEGTVDVLEGWKKSNNQPTKNTGTADDWERWKNLKEDVPADGWKQAPQNVDEWATSGRQEKHVPGANRLWAGESITNVNFPEYDRFTGSAINGDQMIYVNTGSGTPHLTSQVARNLHMQNAAMKEATTDPISAILAEADAKAMDIDSILGKKNSGRVPIQKDSSFNSDLSPYEQKAITNEKIATRGNTEGLGIAPSEFASLTPKFGKYTSDPAFKSIIDDNKGLVFKLIGKHSGLYEREEMVQNAISGLVEAAKSFDRSKGVAFSTWAFPKIERAIINPNKISNAAKRTSANEAGKSMKSLDAPVLEKGSEASYSAVDFLEGSSPDHYTTFYKQFGEDADLARVLSEQSEIRHTGAIRMGDKVSKVKRLTDTQIREELGLTLEQFKAGKLRIKNILK